MFHVSIVWSLSLHKSIETNSIQILLLLICIYSSVPIAFWLWSNWMDGPGQNAFFDEFHPYFRPLPSPAPWRTCRREHQRRHPQLIGLWGQSCTAAASIRCTAWVPAVMQPRWETWWDGLFLALPRESSVPPNTKHTPKKQCFFGWGFTTIWRPDNGGVQYYGDGINERNRTTAITILIRYVISFMSAHEILLDAYDNSHHPQLWLIVVRYRW